MGNSLKTPFIRAQSGELKARLLEPRRFIQVVTGPRQVGKTTLVTQATDSLDIPVRFASADEPTLRGQAWIAQQWEAARAAAQDARGAVLVLDEIQKLQGWSEAVKKHWDEDTRNNRPLKVVLLGSAPLLIAKGITESLAGRFENIPVPHWSFAEMRDAFGWTLDEFIFYGGFPGSATLIADPARWKRYVLDSLVETAISRDVLLLTRVDKPALLRRLFELSCQYSGQILSYTKMLGQLQDAGNTTTLAHYLELLEGAGLTLGLQKYAGDAARSRGSSPKLQALNTALISAMADYSLNEARSDPAYWGQLVESAVGAHLSNASLQGVCQVKYWRERNLEVDFVLSSGRSLVTIEVKSGNAPSKHLGTEAFAQAFKPNKSLLVGGDGIALKDFLQTPVEHWLKR